MTAHGQFEVFMKAYPPGWRCERFAELDRLIAKAGPDLGYEESDEEGGFGEYVPTPPAAERIRKVGAGWNSPSVASILKLNKTFFMHRREIVRLRAAGRTYGEIKAITGRSNCLISRVCDPDKLWELIHSLKAVGAEFSHPQMIEALESELKKMQAWLRRPAEKEREAVA